MEIFVNGDKRQIHSGWNVGMLLKEFHVDPRSVVVEHNEVVLSRSHFDETLLAEGDKIEIVRFIGGGSIHGR
ncbi:MAG TPA: sulfur carrier protein ThiS [Verrucomicrobiae bacterium]|jgi:thiamine biosynthesis protein ThiS|nr:sulfur carrier protein ThiS [Verrucomicrobiae bacterium]